MPTFSEAIIKFKNYKAIRYERASVVYAHCMSIFAKEVGKCLDKLDNDDITAFQINLKRTHQDASQASFAAAIRSFFEFTNGRGWTNINLKEILVPRITEKIPVYVVQSEFETMCDTVKDDSIKLLCLRLLWFTGVRISELCDMTVESLDTTQKCAKVNTRKSFRPKQVFWDDVTNDLIIQCAQGKKGRIFNVTPRQVQRWIQDIANKCGIKKHITPHAFRHGMAHQMLDIGVDLPALQDLLGHKHPSSIFRYTRRLNEDIQEKGREAVRKRQAMAKLKEMARELNLEEMLKEV